MNVRAEALLADFFAGKVSALARAVSIVENQRPGVDDILSALHKKLGRARRIGITGPPGAGKSTITTLLTEHFRNEGLRVGIVCVDPTSPFTGGALLGDRVRMERVALDTGVFIRSMATRGSLGGLAASTREVTDVLDGFGFDRLIIETVGVGQSELDIARMADSTIVVLVPESGDSIQTLKAGVMEIADIFVVNKADRPGADRLRNDVELMLGFRSGAVRGNVPAHHGVELSGRKPVAASVIPDTPAKWTPPVLSSIAAKGEGIVEIAKSLDSHFNYLEQGGTLRTKRRERMLERVVEIAGRKIQQRLWDVPATRDWLNDWVEKLESGVTTPYVVADELLMAHGHLITGRSG